MIILRKEFLDNNCNETWNIKFNNFQELLLVLDRWSRLLLSTSY